MRFLNLLYQLFLCLKIIKLITTAIDTTGRIEIKINPKTLFPFVSPRTGIAIREAKRETEKTAISIRLVIFLCFLVISSKEPRKTSSNNSTTNSNNVLSPISQSYIPTEIQNLRTQYIPLHHR